MEQSHQREDHRSGGQDRCQRPESLRKVSINFHPWSSMLTQGHGIDWSKMTS